MACCTGRLLRSCEPHPGASDSAGDCTGVPCYSSFLMRRKAPWWVRFSSLCSHRSVASACPSPALMMASWRLNIASRIVVIVRELPLQEPRLLLKVGGFAPPSHRPGLPASRCG